MIKINLLPPAFRVVKKKKVAPSPTSANTQRDSKERIKKLALIGAAGLFVLYSVYLDFDYFQLKQKMKTLGSEMVLVQPQMQSLKALEQQVTETLVPERDFLMRHVLSKAPVTVVLQKMSTALPDGIWLENLIFNNFGQERSFSIRGSAINLENKTNIEQIEEYLQQLKTIIPNAQFTYSTSKQVVDNAPVTIFNAEYKWQAD